MITAKIKGISTSVCPIQFISVPIDLLVINFSQFVLVAIFHNIGLCLTLNINTMKTSIKILGILLFVVAVAASCDKNNNPSDDNLFAGQYQGTVSYSNPENNTNISTEEGQVTVVKIGNTYSFNFSNEIPGLKDIKMEKNQNILVSTNGAISIDESNLKIVYSDDGKTWGASCSR